MALKFQDRSPYIHSNNIVGVRESNWTWYTVERIAISIHNRKLKIEVLLYRAGMLSWIIHFRFVGIVYLQ